MNNPVSSARFVPNGVALPGVAAALRDTPQALCLWSSIAWRSRFAQVRAKSPNLLLVSWAFPPLHQTSAHFPKAVVCAAARLGVPYAVLSAPSPADPTPQGLEMLEDLPEDAQIHRVDVPLGPDNNPTLGQRLWGIPTIDGKFMTALLQAKTGMERLAASPPSTIMAFGPRFVNFVAAYYLARWSGAKLALFYIDEWTVKTPPFVSVGPHDRVWEQRCLRQAQSVYFVTEGKRRAYREAFPFLAEKELCVFENGWDPRPFEKIAAAPPKQINKDVLTIDFVGVAATHTPIAPFFETLARSFQQRPDLRRRVVVRLTGTPTAYAEACVATARASGVTVDLESALPQSAAVSRMTASGALLLLLNTGYEGLIPQKTYDYLRCGAPILAYGTASEGARFIEQCGAGPVVREGDAAQLARAIERLLTMERGAWQTPARQAFVASRNREDIATSLLKTLMPGR